MTSTLLPPVLDAAAALLIAARRGADPEVPADDLCDVLWLAPRLPEWNSASPAGNGSPGPTKPPAGPQPSAPAPASPRDTAQMDQIHLQLVDSSPGVGVRRSGTPVRMPAPQALPEALAIGRALRPLRVRRPSRVRHRVDEAATADRAMRTGIWHPLLRSRPERWPDAAVVVDGTASMAIWHQEIGTLCALLGQLGAFRELRTWRLEAPPGSVSRISPRFRRPEGDRPDRLLPAAATLRDPAGRRLVVVVTDGMDPAWGDGTHPEALRTLAGTNPVMVVSLVPQWLWPAGGLRVRPGQVRLESPLLPNARWRYQPVDAPDSPDRDGRPIPVTDLTAWRLGRCAGVLGGGAGWLRTRLLDSRSRPAAGSTPLPAGQNLAEHLRSRISVGAHRLLLALAQMPDMLVLGAIRQVQHRLLPNTGVIELAEVLHSGVLVPCSGAARADTLFRFVDGEAQAALATAGDQVLHAEVRRVLGEALRDGPARSQYEVAGVALATRGPTFPVVAGEPTAVPRRTPAPVPEPVRDLRIWDLVGGVDPQRRHRARELAATPGRDRPALLCLDVPDLARDPDRGIGRLDSSVREAAPGTALYLDGSDRLGGTPELRGAVIRLLGDAAAGRPGPHRVILGRARRTQPGMAPAALDDGWTWEQVEIAGGQAVTARCYLILVSTLGQLPPSTQDALWAAVLRSQELPRLPRRRLFAAYAALGSEIRERWRTRVGQRHQAPVEVVDIPQNIDDLLKRRA